MPIENPDPTFMQQALRVHALYQQIADIRDGQSVSETDSRRVNLNNVMMAANAAGATLRLLNWIRRSDKVVISQALDLSKPEYVAPVAEDLLRASRLFLLVEAQFQTETLFRNVLAAAGEAGNAKGYYNVARHVIACAGLTEPNRRLRILQVPALMRNSMHANGIHHGWKGSDTVEIIAGVEFRFEHGKRVQCGSWYHIVTALSASFEVVGEVLGSSAVKALVSVPDLYAEQAAGE